MGDLDRERRRPGLPVAAAVPLLTLLWLLIAVGCVLAVGAAPSGAQRPVPALVLIVLFTATQTFVINVQVRREARSVFVSELAMILALLSLTAPAVAAVRVGAAVVAFGLLRRQYRQPRKLMFNLALSAAEAGLATLCFHLVVRPSAPVPLTWAAAVLGTAVASAFTALAVALVIELLDGSPRLWPLLRLTAAGFLQAVPVAVVGCAFWAAWESTPWAALPLAVMVAIVLVSYRAYAGLREKHVALERLFRFSQVVSHAPGVDEVLRNVLQQAREILHAERARLTFVSDLATGEGVEVVLEGDAVFRRGPAVYLADTPWALEAVISGREGLLLSRATRDPVHRRWLDRHGVRDSIMTPFLGESGPVAVLAVDDRLGDVRGFEPEDLRLLTSVANQASVALQNGELLDRLRHESLHDPLTKLPNRMKFQRELEARLGQVPQPDLAVGILDLDSFKEVNDTLGHQEGDRLLCEIALRMEAALGGDDLVARLGGDEFAVLLTGSATIEDALLRGRRLLDAFAAPVLLAGIAVDVSGSLGLALSGLHGDAAGLLLKRADAAMYEAKHVGREVRVFDPATDTSSPSKLALVAELRRAIDEGAVTIHVQPKVDAATGRLSGAEALARWRTDERGEVLPTEFVPLAERSGLIRPLTELVLDAAVKACAQWQATAPDVGVAVNVSVRSLADDGLLRLVERMLQRYALAPWLLTLEITESHIMADPAGTIGVLHGLRALGVRLSVDDFGTGYSSLSYLRRLPVDEIKIDQSFVHRMVDEPDDAAIVRSIIELARTLGLHVVAEGVEDEATWSALKALGVQEVQGWVVARSMPSHDLALWATARPGPARWLEAI